MLLGDLRPESGTVKSYSCARNEVGDDWLQIALMHLNVHRTFTYVNLFKSLAAILSLPNFSVKLPLDTEQR